jgi:hypothetical protein
VYGATVAIVGRKQDHMGLQAGAVRQNDLLWREVVDLRNEFDAVTPDLF